MQSTDKTEETPGETRGPAINVLTQYVKSLSFGNPGVPKSLGASNEAPHISITVNVRGRSLQNKDFEVDLELISKATRDKEVIFVAEIVYSGVFRISGVPAESLQTLVLVECPRLLFPFVRNILADLTRYGGYAPLLIDPIDFAELYGRNLTTHQVSEGSQSVN